MVRWNAGTEHVTIQRQIVATGSEGRVEMESEWTARKRVAIHHGRRKFLG